MGPSFESGGLRFGEHVGEERVRLVVLAEHRVCGGEVGSGVNGARV